MLRVPVALGLIAVVGCRQPAPPSAVERRPALTAVRADIVQASSPPSDARKPGAVRGRPLAWCAVPRRHDPLLLDAIELGTFAENDGSALDDVRVMHRIALMPADQIVLVTDEERYEQAARAYDAAISIYRSSGRAETSFLSRVGLVIGLSFLMMVILMVIHWEPERPVARAAAETAAPAPIAASTEPTVQRATAVQTATTESAYGDVRIDWVIQDAQATDELPAGVREALAGCVIPRSAGFPNVISGKFKQAGESRGPQRGSRDGVEVDLAVLCVRGEHATVYVFWAGNPSDVEIAMDFDFIPATYIRTAQLADIEVEVRRELPIEPGMPLRIRHDGLQLGNGCCATTHYWHRGRWRSYVSAD